MVNGTPHFTFSSLDGGHFLIRVRVLAAGR